MRKLIPLLLILTAHTYGAPGIYQVLHIISDSTGSCNDSVMHSIAIDSSVTCKASFVASRDTLHAAIYHFASTSSGNGSAIISYQWTVNGHIVSANAAFTDTLSPGISTICLTIQTAAGCSNSSCTNVLVDTSTHCNLNADFVATVRRDTVFLQSVDSGFSLLHSWKFGDGTIGSGQNTFHIYHAPGTYTITHYVTDSASHCTDSAKRIIQIGASISCRASFIVLRDSTDKKRFNFISTSTAQGGTITAYRWTLDGHVVSTTNAFFTKLKKGAHVVVLDIKTSAGCTSSARETVIADSVKTQDSIPVISSYPNPVPGGSVNLQLALENNAKVKVTVYNSRGIVVFTQERNYSTGFNMLSIPVDKLQRGQYYIDIQYGNTRKRSVFQKL